MKTESFNHKFPNNFISLINRQKQISATRNKEIIERVRQQEAFVSLMMVGEIEASLQSMLIAVRDSGLMKHDMKKECNSLFKIIRLMQYSATVVDRTLTMNCCNSILPGYEKCFVNDNGSAIMGLQNRFHLLLKDKEEQLFLCLKQLSINVKHPYATVYARICHTKILTQLSLDVSEFYVRILKKNFGVNCSIHEIHNEKAIIASSNRMMAFLTKETIRKQDSQDVERYIVSLSNLITGQEVVNILENTEIEIYRLYCEYFLAMLRCDIDNDCIPSFTVRRSLFLKLYDKKGVRSLLDELKTIPPRMEDEDIYDLSSRLSQFHALVIDEFRSLIFRSTSRLTADKLKFIKVENLIHEVMENGGILPLGTLRQLYSETGSKEAILELISLMGEKGKSTGKFLETLNEKDLKEVIT